MDVVTYALAKKMASSVASGITEIETNGTTIRFKTTSGDWFTVTLNSINEVSVSANGHLIVKLSDGTQIDCGALPVGTMDSSLSTTSENGVQNKVITNALNGKQNTLVQGSGITIDNTDPSHPQISANIDYTNLINKPTKLSDFTNDENFITNTANNLSNYYLKTETYTQTEVNDLISSLASLSVEIVETLPTSDISTTTIYLINVSDTTNYVQWMYINNAWANIGSTSVDLTNYYTKTQTDTLLNGKVDKVSGKGLSTNDFTNAYKSILDNYSVDSTLDSTSTNPVQNAVVTQALDTKQPKTLSSPITIGGTSQTTVEGALGGLNSLCGTKLTMVTSLPLSPSNQETVLYIGNSSGSLLCGGIYQYQVSEWVMISNVSSFTFNSDEFTVDSTTNEVSLKPSYADIPSFLPNNVSSSNKLATNSSITAITDLIPSNATSSNKLVAKSDTVIRHDYSITGTTDTIADIKNLVNHITTLGVGTYAGEFKRSGITFGSYRLTYLIDGIYSKSVSGLVTFSINVDTDATYQVSYVEDIEHGTPLEWKIEKLVTESDNNFTYQVLATDTDLNTVKTSGAYSIYISDATSQATNHAPNYGWLQLIVIQMNNSPSFCNQILCREDVMYTRKCGNDVWSDWKRIAINTVQSGTYTIPAQTLANGAYAELEIPLVPTDFYCGRIDFGNLPAHNISLSYNDFSGTFQDTRTTENRSQFVLYPIGKANLATLHVYLTNYTGSPVTISDIPVNYYLEHHAS